MNLNPQWIWIAAGVIAVVLIVVLVASVARRRQETLRPPTADARERFRAEWRRVEEMFIDRPASAVVQAEELVSELVRTRGVTLRHPRVAERYDAGHAVIDRHSRAKASTEDLRQALLHYRGIYEDLTGERTDVATAIPTAAEVEPRRDTIREDERPRV
jgi:heme exporter protein D